MRGRLGPLFAMYLSLCWDRVRPMLMKDSSEITVSQSLPGSREGMVMCILRILSMSSLGGRRARCLLIVGSFKALKAMVGGS